MKNMKRIVKPMFLTIIAAAAVFSASVADWRVTVGAETPDRGSQALAFLPNEIWIHAGDSIHWSFPTHERYTVTFLKPGQTRPPGFGPVFGIPVGCPGVTPDGSSFDGSACVTTAINDDPSTPIYTINFPSPGNFKFVCLLHADMTGLVHALNVSDPLPHDQVYYDRIVQNERAHLLSNASRLRGSAEEGESGQVAAGVGIVLTTSGPGSSTASLMRFLPGLIVVRVGDTVEWTSLDPSINHTVTFGTEPADPRPPSAGVTATADGARQAIITSQADSVNSGFLSPAPQERAGLPLAPPGVTRFRVTFNTPGTFNYICAIHDQLGMKGTVLVH
jgi:plastocyanin